MRKYYIYLEQGIDHITGDNFTQKRYYQEEVSSPNLIYIGSCEVNDLYFCATQTIHYDVEKAMYTRKEIVKAEGLARESGNILVAGMLSDYSRLRYSFIPQLLEKFTPRVKGFYFPHMTNVKK